MKRASHLSKLLPSGPIAPGCRMALDRVAQFLGTWASAQAGDAATK